MTIRIAVASAVLALVSAACSKTASDNGTLLSAIREIDARTTDLTAPDELFEKEGFVPIYENAPRYHAEAAALLERQDLSEKQKEILVFSMQNLPPAEHLAFLNELFELRKAGKISQVVYENGAFPPLQWNSDLAEHFTDPQVVAYLKKVRADDGSARWRGYIDRVLSGQTAKDVKEMRDAGQIKKKR